MNAVASVLASVAAAAAFFLLEPFLLGLAEPWRFAGTGVVLALAAGLSLYFNKSVGQKGSADGVRKVMSGNKADTDLSVDVDGLDTTQANGKVLADNKSGGKTTIKVKNSKF